MEWLKDDSWKMKHSSKEIYLMINHKWAFVVWELALINNVIKDNSALVHVDSHLDDWVDLSLDPRYYKAKTEQDIKLLGNYKNTDGNIDYELDYANFIIPSFVRNTIRSIIYVSDYNNTELSVDQIYNFVIENSKSSFIVKHIEMFIKNTPSIKRFYSVEDYFKAPPVIPPNQSKILDLDLDYFNDSDNLLFSNLKTDKVIKDNLRHLKEQHDWDLITVALSPSHCGGDQECLHIFKLFLEVFELNFADFEYWL
ncbi:hypothetical protein ABE61_22710 [Lysinibacillus sphaericus]|uniref:UPF0489 family protein n=1 Tax=Lysinibacillus sphaericus TaxID=1421 RepID=UPI0018CE3651|nr:UPF0489 family protein [Lysinibacillus sphaericus]MBG9456744.1 hypothetical protein [Lysinibacillus sphaericus]MBG9476908.1 hypothetical protein [Lysinibacillus sphaericus]MBG9591457.1 hypothetical protein [Lysinibacillus sphaericus]